MESTEPQKNQKKDRGIVRRVASVFLLVVQNKAGEIINP